VRIQLNYTLSVGGLVWGQLWAMGHCAYTTRHQWSRYHTVQAGIFPTGA